MSEQQAKAGGEEEAQQSSSSSSPSRKPPPLMTMPPPPTLKSSSPPIGSISAPPAPLSGGLLSSLPPPPSLIAPRGNNSANMNGSSGAPSSAVTMPLPLPPPPTVSSSLLPPPPTLRSTPATATTTVVPPTNSSSVNKVANNKAIITQSVHSTTEQIPILESAPNSGVSLSSNKSIEEQHQYQKQHQPQQQISQQQHNATNFNYDQEESETEGMMRAAKKSMYFGSKAYQSAFTSNSTTSTSTLSTTANTATGKQQQKKEPPGVNHSNVPITSESMTRNDENLSLPVDPPPAESSSGNGTGGTGGGGGNSWSAWAGNTMGNITSTVATNIPSSGGLPAGSRQFLEKAGQLAYSTVESAGDLLAASSSYEDGEHAPPKSAAEGVGGGYATLALDSHTTAAVAAGGIAVKDNFASLFGQQQHSQQGGNGDAAYSSSSTSGHMMSESMTPDIMATPDTSVHPTSVVPPPPAPTLPEGTPQVVNRMALPKTSSDQVIMEMQTQQKKLQKEYPSVASVVDAPVNTQQQQQSNVQQTVQTTAAIQQQSQKQQPITTKTSTTPLKKRAAASPPSTILAPRQSHLSILILPTADAQSIATKNNTTLSELFCTYGNSSTSTTTHSRTGAGTTQTVDKSLEPMLPPFRSAHRSMALRWENILLNFVSNIDMDSMPYPENECETALGISARLWDEDQLDLIAASAAGSGSSNMGSKEDRLEFLTNENEEDDLEMDQLEGYVVDALAEEDQEELSRKRDGIPSMTSVSPSSRRNSQVDTTEEERNNDDGAEHREQPFPPAPGEALQQTSDAAFALTAHPTSPWLLRFRHTLDCCTDGMYHEMLNNPSVVILAASTSEPNYVNCLAELANVHHLPKPYHDGRYDPNGLRREFLLLHDVIHGPKDFDENVALHLMRERFGPGCCEVLRINSMVPRTVVISDGYATAGEDGEWENMGPRSPFVGSKLSMEYNTSISAVRERPVRGGCLSPSDKRAIRRYVANMVATGLVPAVERRIAHLNSAVTNAKKGVKNVIKSFWRKPKENILVNVSGYSDGNNNSGGGNVQRNSNHNTSDANVRYRFDTIESQTRLLADTLFLMHDYDAALSAYRLVKDDYKHDKANLHYASVQEMMVLCMHSLDPSGRDGRFTYDVHHSIETALYSYTRAADEEKESNASSGVRPGKAPYATRLATRLCLALSSARSLCEGKHMEIADLLASASSHETPLGAAILLEQSSAHYYRAGMLRKYAFHMLMAGHMFRSAGKQERHAFRCFAASLYVYHGERWGELRSHLRSALAAQLYGMDRYALSMQFYAKLIGMAGGGRVSVRSQQKFLNHIVNICKDHESAAIVAIDRMNNINQGGGTSESRREEGMLKGFTDAVRQIEISNIGFPHVQDSSLQVRVDITGNSAMSLHRSDSTLASSSDGEETVWQDMSHCADAELRAFAISSTVGISSNNHTEHSEDGPAPPAAHSGDDLIDRVITEIDKEEREAEHRERQKKKGGVRTPEVRAKSEPLSVTFSLKNPLGLDIELTEMQLVASLTSKLGVSHTNEFPISKQGSNSIAGKGWTFHGSKTQYHTPKFMCQVPPDSDSSGGASEIDKVTGPHFVVTTSSTTMGPNSDTTVALKICPLVEGDLKILGVRFHLLGDIWIYHQFDLPGPLLQDNRVNRSKRVRGESLVLRSKIEQEMPSLRVNITPDESTQSTVLQGQTCRWKLKLSNVGYAPAKNIMLKTNAPWLNLVQLGDRKLPNENSPISSCIGPSGTLMRISFDTLQPGESLEVPVAIRTSGGGRQDFYMLFRYELGSAESSFAGLVPRHRWARKLLSVPVYPSITMSASLMPSYSNKGEHILSVELMNYRSDRETKLEILLNKICIASRHFEIKEMQGQVTSGDLIPMSTSLKIGWQERVTLHYLVVPIKRSNPSLEFSTLSFSSGNEVAPEAVSIVQLPDFMCRERAHEVFSSTLKSHRIDKERLLIEQEKEGQPRDIAQIRRDKSSLPGQESNISSTSEAAPGSAPRAHPTSLASLCPLSGSSNINIICCWSAVVGDNGNDNTIYGQHHLRDLLVRPLNKSKGCPLAITANYESRVSHDFNKGPLDENIDIIIRNRLIESEVEFQFVIDHQPGVDFVGTTCFNCSLSGLDELTVPLKARIYSGGVFNLQNVRLTVPKEAGTTVPYLFPLQWTMVVKDSAGDSKI